MTMTVATGTAHSVLAAPSSGRLSQGQGLASSSFSQLAVLRSSRAGQLSTRVAGKHFLREQQTPKRGLVVYAEYNGRRGGGGAGDFLAGFLIGGALFGAIGYLIAPTVNKTLAAVAEKEKEDIEDEGPPKKLPKYADDDDEGLEKTRKNLNDKIAQLNAAIDDVSAQLRADDGVFSSVNDSAVELESAA
ncbi:hypothetical protein R1sor_027441 [Riccia sorocarpa]|uniref:Uncharacterized protein n=1 Tax=Riccia sorocarpa TaxID=122646 RepID=A0ABD3GE89_9MARC